MNGPMSTSGPTCAPLRQTISRELQRNLLQSDSCRLVAKAAGGRVSDFEPGSYVSHARLTALGTGEVVLTEKGNIRIRFASGDRQFVLALVKEHLALTFDFPRP